MQPPQQPAVDRPASNAAEMLPPIYNELRRLAATRLSREKPGQTLQATALVHEAWLRMEGSQNGSWNDPAHFFAIAAEAMRRILVENARRKLALKRGGNLERVSVEELPICAPLPDDRMLLVDEALNQLAVINPQAAQVVKLRFFVGLTEAQVAEHLKLSIHQERRIWLFARAWLLDAIRSVEHETANDASEIHPELKKYRVPPPKTTAENRIYK